MAEGDAQLYRIRGVTTSESSLKPKIQFQCCSYSLNLTLNNVVAENISINPSQAETQQFTVLGRSSPPMIYTGNGARTLSFSFKLYRELFEKSTEKSSSNRYQEVIDTLDSFNYPLYTEYGTVPPVMMVIINKTIRLKGVPSISYSFEGPIDKWGRYIVANFNVTITEFLNVSWDATEIRNGAVSRKSLDKKR